MISNNNNNNDDGVPPSPPSPEAGLNDDGVPPPFPPSRHAGPEPIVGFIGYLEDHGFTNEQMVAFLAIPQIEAERNHQISLANQQAEYSRSHAEIMRAHAEVMRANAEVARQQTEASQERVTLLSRGRRGRDETAEDGPHPRE